MTDLYYIEDDRNIALAVKEYLEQKGFHVTICTTHAEAKLRLRGHVPACILLDWNMPDGRGDHFCRWVRGNWKELPVLFLTVRGDSSDIVAGFRSGADDYVVKPFELEVLYARILAVLRRTGNMAERYLSCDGIRIDQDRHAVFLHSEEIALSMAEYQLLLYLMRNKGKTVTREKLLEQVWDANGNYVNDNTLTVTMKRLRDKLSQLARLTRLEESLLVLARLDAGTLTLRKEKTDVFTLLVLAADNLQELFSNSGASIEIPEQGEMLILADMEWTMEAIMNLMKNCIEHNPGGTVRCSCAQNPLYTEIRIRDEGPGFAREDLPHLFERFYHGQNASEGSVGIGLALARELIERQNGTIQAKNSPEGGALFEIRFYRH